MGLTAAPITIAFAGRVLADEDGQPIPLATVHVDRGGGNLVGTVANESGIYYFDRGAPGETVYVRATGRETLIFDIPREPGMYYTHRLRSNAQLGEFEVIADKPDQGGGTPAPPGAIPWGPIAAIGGALLLLLLAPSGDGNEQRGTL